MGKVAAPTAIPPVKKLAAPKTKPRIVVEGDSWFRLPFWYPKDVVDYLNEDFDINPLAMWGDTLENIFAQKQYLQVLGAGLRHHLLLSGGGNDVLGSINKYVDKRKAGDTNAKTASKYVRPQFETVIKKLIGYYRGIVVEVRSRINEPVTIYLHGYACAIPRQGGKYLGGPLKKLGFDPDEHAGMCAEIVRHMINRFNEELAKLASSQARVVYVDLRPAFTSKNDWHDDEIHPSSKGARKAATVLRNSINANLAVA
jgi:lysophospholipase L1-like esterase